MNSRNNGIDCLRGLAILAVIGLHSLSQLGYSFYALTSPYRPWLIAINQLFRLSVPVFLVTSGYLLSLKYLHQPFDGLKYFFKRVMSLLPLYLFWSGVIFLVLHLHPSWSGGPLSLSAFIYGSVDYHLYYIPMLIGLYALFPLLFWLNRLNPYLLLLTTFVGELIWFNQIQGLPDQQQYLSPVTWIFYFVLGITLPAFLPRFSKSPRFSIITFAVLSVITLFLSWYMANLQNLQGVDVIVTTRFTRWPILLYAGCLSVLGMLLLPWLNRSSHWSTRFLAIAGKYSLLIYLSHTLWLRLLYSITHQSVDFITIVLALLLTGAATVVSLK